MAGSEKFDSEALIKKVGALEGKMNEFAEVLRNINAYIEANVNVSVASAVFGDYGTKLLTIWSENASTFGDFHANFSSWLEVISVISTNKQNFAVGVKELYRNNGNNLDGIKEIREAVENKENPTAKEIDKIIRANTKVSKDKDRFNVQTDVSDYVKVANLILNEDYNEILNTLLEKYSGRGGLKRLTGTDTLYNYVSKEEVSDALKVVQNKYDGRASAVYSILTLFNLCSTNGVWLDYKHQGTAGIQPYVPTDKVANGVDCNAFASWAVDKGTPGGFQWRPVWQFSYVGEKMDDWTKAQAGDVFVSAGHVGVILANDPASGKFITAESSNGVQIRTRTYNELVQSGYQVQDMTTVYDGTEITDRTVFNQYIPDWDSYVRPSVDYFMEHHTSTSRDKKESVRVML